MSTCLTNIGGVYNDDNQFEEALKYLSRAVVLHEELNNNRGLSYALSTMGSAYMNRSEFGPAIESFSRSLALNEVRGDKQGMLFGLNGLGATSIKQKDYRAALKWCNKALTVAKEVSSIEQEKLACLCLYDGFKGLGDFESALRYYEEMTVLKDSIFNEANTKELTRIEVEYEFEKKETIAKAEQEKKDAIAAEQLRRKNQQRNAFIGGFVLMLGLAGVSYRSYLTKKKDNAIITQEKARSEELLLNILPHEVAEELKAKGAADAQLLEHVTVLFTDFKGFTQLSESLSPKELVADLNECFTAFDRICEKHGIEKIKTIGDAYMAAGGLPTPNTTHAHDVLKAALEMVEFVEKGKARKQAAALPFFEIRIGIHTGPVVAGIVGVKKFQYDIWGDTVNTASRMESSGEVGRVNISEATYALVKDEFVCEYRGEVEAKGKGKLGMWFASARIG